jgi:lipopolysaccharide/colanic/teichoic acid biosynthesis glycosyltransferase
MRKQIYLYLVFDILSVSLIYCLFLYFKPAPFLDVFENYFPSFMLFVGIWIITSYSINKYRLEDCLTSWYVIRRILLGNFLILGMITTLMYLFRIEYFSRTIVFGTILTATFTEIAWALLYYFTKTAIPEPNQVILRPQKIKRSLSKTVSSVPKISKKGTLEYKSREDEILVEIDEEAFEFIFSYAHIDSPKTLVISTTSRFNVNTQLEKQFEAIVNLKRINDIRYINKFFEAVNAKLPIGGLFIDFVESKNLRKRRILRKFPPVINYIAYSIDFVIKRILPKFAITKDLYFLLTRGQNRVLTKAETHGRLYSCGFEIIDEKLASNHLFFIARKTSKPLFPKNPSYGPLIKLERIGYMGRIINVYKFRTMHPYAEYLQDYLYKKEGLKEGGKFKSDYRISTLGKIMRTFWIDELPMLINLFRLELKIFGVRPLSRQYFSLYDEELQKRRIKYHPGLIPPFYVDNPKTLQEIMESEIRYLDAFDRHPMRTDIKYFFKAIYNILFKKYRSN